MTSTKKKQKDSRRKAKAQRPQRATGQALVDLLQNSPLRDLTIDHEPVYAPVHDVEL